ncbi:uncharacterized protein [Centruroides vittatus]|uniref:uncharacterized protein n=1 Tax=Centruroides vittatus TaxID=120091 RepID=UPI003510B678
MPKKLAMKDKIAMLEDRIISKDNEIMQLKSVIRELQEKIKNIEKKEKNRSRNIENSGMEREPSPTVLEDDGKSDVSSVSPINMMINLINQIREEYETRFNKLENTFVNAKCADSNPSISPTLPKGPTIPQKLISWPAFDPQNINIWLEKLQGIKECFELDDTTFISTLKLQSDIDLVKRIRLEEAKGYELTWTRLKAQIKKWYETDSTVKKTIKMYDRVQGKLESAFSYVLDKLELINSLNHEYSEIEKIELLNNGLQKEERMSIANKTFHTLDDYTNAIMELDSITKREREKYYKSFSVGECSNRPNGISRSPKPYSYSYKEQSSRQNRELMDRERKSVYNKRSKTFRRTNNRNNGIQSEQAISRNQTVPEESSNDIICHNCWNRGHYKKICKYPKFYAFEKMRQLMDKLENQNEEQKN